MRFAPWLVAASLFLALLSGTLTLAMAVLSASAEEGVRHTLTVRQTATDLLNALDDAETAERGYALTDHASYLAQYNAAVASIPKRFAQLKALTHDSALQQRRLDSIWPLMTARLDLLRTGVDLAKQRGTNAARPPVTVDATVRSLMQRIRRTLDQFSQTELEVAADRTDAAEARRSWLFGAGSASLLLAIAMIGGLGWGMLRALRTVEQRAHALASEIGRREATEDLLRQSQRLDALGRLAGGIAHDFNNLLMIAKGNLTLLRRHIDNAQKALTYVAGADSAMQRAADLTDRILAFSRRKELKFEPLCLSEVVEGMAPLLQHTVDDAIKIETRLKSRWHALGDIGQLENIILNLVINARDAMANGGRIVIATEDRHLAAAPSNVVQFEPGDYVVLIVADNGEGMSQDVQDRAMDPYYSTKAHGKGTGLGLAMAHGYATQCSGHLQLISAPGKGTDVTMYFPRAEGPSAVSAAA
jgi:signal transduction histidine kinase